MGWIRGMEPENIAVKRVSGNLRRVFGVFKVDKQVSGQETR